MSGYGILGKMGESNAVNKFLAMLGSFGKEAQLKWSLLIVGDGSFSGAKGHSSGSPGWI
jgi:hypothetical protein